MNGVDYIDSRVVLRILTEFEVSSVQARTGWNVGGISATITGVGFHRSLRDICRFGHDLPETEATSFINATSLTCATP